MAANPLRRLAHGIVSAFTSIKDAYIEEKIAEARKRRDFLKEGPIEYWQGQERCVVGTCYESLMPRSAGDYQAEKDLRKLHPRPMLTKARPVYLEKKEQNRLLQAANAEFEKLNARIEKHDRKKLEASTGSSKSTGSGHTEASSQHSASRSTSSISQSRSTKQGSVHSGKEARKSPPKSVPKEPSPHASEHARSHHASQSGNAHRPGKDPSGSRREPGRPQQRSGTSALPDSRLPSEGSQHAPPGHIPTSKRSSQVQDAPETPFSQLNQKKSRSSSSSKLSGSVHASASRGSSPPSARGRIETEKKNHESSALERGVTKRTAGRSTPEESTSSPQTSGQRRGEKSEHSSKKPLDRPDQPIAAEQPKTALDRSQLDAADQSKSLSAAQSAREGNTATPPLAPSTTQSPTGKPLLDTFFSISSPQANFPPSSSALPWGTKMTPRESAGERKNLAHRGSSTVSQESPRVKEDEVTREILDLFRSEPLPPPNPLARQPATEYSLDQALRELNEKREKEHQEEIKKLTSSKHKGKLLELASKSLPYQTGEITLDFPAGDAGRMGRIGAFYQAPRRLFSFERHDTWADICSHLVCAQANHVLETLAASYAELYRLRFSQPELFNQAAINRILNTGRGALPNAMQALAQAAQQNGLALPEISPFVDRWEEAFNPDKEEVHGNRRMFRNKFEALIPDFPSAAQASEVGGILAKRLAEDKQWIRIIGNQVFQEILGGLRELEKNPSGAV